MAKLQVAVIGISDGKNKPGSEIIITVNALPVKGGTLTTGRGINRKAFQVLDVDSSSDPPTVYVQT